MFIFKRRKYSENTITEWIVLKKYESIRILDEERIGHLFLLPSILETLPSQIEHENENGSL